MCFCFFNRYHKNLDRTVFWWSGVISPKGPFTVHTVLCSPFIIWFQELPLQLRFALASQLQFVCGCNDWTRAMFGITLIEITNKPHGSMLPANLQGPNGQRTAGGNKDQQNVGSALWHLTTNGMNWIVHRVCEVFRSRQVDCFQISFPHGAASIFQVNKI